MFIGGSLFSEGCVFQMFLNIITSLFIDENRMDVLNQAIPGA